MSPPSRCSLIPAPGPLSWLFPEVARLEDVDGIGGGDGGSDRNRVDLGRRPRTAADLQEELRSYDEVRIADGPRGRCLGRILGQAFRREGPAVVLSPEPSQLELSLVRFAKALAPTQVLSGSGDGCSLDELAADQIGFLPLLPGRAAADTASVLRSWSREKHGRVVPVFLTDPEPAKPASTRLAESWWGLLPGDDYPDALRQAHHDLLRRVWPDRFLHFRALENYALAGFDLYEEIWRGRYDERPKPEMESGPRPLILGIDGIDGAGKSSQLSALRSYLESRGLSVGVHKIYRHGVFHDTVTDLTRQCAGDRNLHLWPLQRHIKLFDSVKYYFSEVAPDLGRYDVLIFDRYVQTHLAAGLGRYGHDPYARELLSVYPPADRVYLLDLEAETALARIAGRNKKTTVDENPYMLGRFRSALCEIAAEDGLLVLNAEDSFEANRARIRTDVDRLLEERA